MANPSMVRNSVSIGVSDQCIPASFIRTGRTRIRLWTVRVAPTADDWPRADASKLRRPDTDPPMDTIVIEDKGDEVAALAPAWVGGRYRDVG